MLGKNLNQKYRYELNPQTEFILEELGIPVCNLTETQMNRELEIGDADSTKNGRKLIAKTFAKIRGK